MDKYDRGIHTNSIQTLINIGRNKQTPEATLRELAQHKLAVVWAAVADNEAAPPDLLVEIATKAVKTEAEQEAFYEAECNCDDHVKKRDGSRAEAN